jgi:hypothetical protein
MPRASGLDKARWAIPYALLTPLLPIFISLNWQFQQVISGRIVDYAFAIISGVVFWGVFGVMLGKLNWSGLLVQMTAAEQAWRGVDESLNHSAAEPQPNV